MRLLLSSGANVEDQDSQGRTPLHLAAKLGDNSQITTALLLAAGADVNSLSGFRETALHCAIISEAKSDNVVRLLLKNGATTRNKDNFGRTILDDLQDKMMASEEKEQLALLLVHYGDDIELRDSTGKSFLAVAASKRWVNVVNALLQKGADTGSKDDDGYTLLYLALINSHEDIAIMILEYSVNIEQKNAEGFTILALAAYYGFEKLTRILLEKGADTRSKDDDGHTPLHLAVKTSHEQIAIMILEYSVDIEQKDATGFSILASAIYYGFEKLTKILLEKGADTGSKDDDGYTPLQLAVRTSHEEIAIMILEYSVDIERKDATGFSILALAAYYGFEKLTKILLEKGADIGSTNHEGHTPLHLAVRNSHEQIALSLLEYSVDIEQKDTVGQSILVWAVKLKMVNLVAILLKKGAYIECHNLDRLTPLALVVSKGKCDERTQIIGLLLENGADVDCTIGNYETLLHYCVSHSDIENVRTLLYYGADVNSHRHHAPYYTPLHRSTSPAITELLLSAGADIEGNSLQGETPLVATFAQNHMNTKVLLQNGANANAVNITTPLLVDALKSRARYGLVELLLAYGADPEQANSSGSKRRPISSTANWKQYINKGGVYPVGRLLPNPIAKNFVRKKLLVENPTTSASGPTSLMNGPNGEYREVGSTHPLADSAQVVQVLLANDIKPGQLTRQQLAALQGQNPSLQQKSVQMYA
jgi:ankyrin repeat protein